MSDYRSKTDGVIDTVEISIEVSGDNEHLADLIHTDLTSRADELNQIVELGRHPDAVNPPSSVDWEGWLAGEYEKVEQERYQDTDKDRCKVCGKPVDERFKKMCWACYSTIEGV